MFYTLLSTFIGVINSTIIEEIVTGISGVSESSGSYLCGASWSLQPIKKLEGSLHHFQFFDDTQRTTRMSSGCSRKSGDQQTIKDAISCSFDLSIVFVQCLRNPQRSDLWQYINDVKAMSLQQFVHILHTLAIGWYD
jgi:hypothetical protein